jgi:hypothetical protein
LEPSEVLKLRVIIRTNAIAAAEFAKLREVADRALDDEPDPIEKVISEGHLANDPLKIRSGAATKDINKTDCLGWTWAVTGDERYAAKVRDYILAWAKVNKADGDAINETKFEPMIIAYDLLRKSFPAREQTVADNWLRNKAETLLAKEKGFGGNWPCHRLKVIGLVGLTIGDESLITQAMDGFRKQVAKDIRADGSCSDFYVRDSMHYQLYSVEPLLTLARASERHGEHLFDYQVPNGASLHSAVDFVVPFADGTKSHIEFANTKSSFDRRRASNGEKEYQPHPWDSKASIDMFSTAACFNSVYGKLAAKIDGTPNETFINWQMVINAASQPIK